MTLETTNIRNVSLLGHAGCGKTTFAETMLFESGSITRRGTVEDGSTTSDFTKIEKERQGSIFSTLMHADWRGNKINIIDTPGHADFGGEVERTLHMADGCLLIVDAQEGPMPQTRFVLKQALGSGLRPIVIINKIDKPAARISQVEDEIADLFLELASDEAQLHYPVYYAVGRDGKVWDSVPKSFENDEATIELALDAIIEHVPAPAKEDGSLQLLVTSLEWDNYEGKHVVGKIERGSIKAKQQITLLTEESTIGTFKVESVYSFKGLGKIGVESAGSGEVVSLTGIKGAQIGQTVSDIENPEALPTIELEPPTLSMYIGPNTSPFKGQEGEFTTSRQIGDRLHKELETNIGLKLRQEDIGFIVEGRGELHLSVLIETMRREGYEFEVGRPQVVYQEKDGKILEPFEEVSVEVPPEHVGVVQSEFGKRRAELIEQGSMESGMTTLKYRLATKALLGTRSILVTATKGTIIMHSSMSGYEEKTAPLDQQRNGVLIAWENGQTTPYALQNAESRGTLLVTAGVKTYMGQIIGISNQRDDLDFNASKEKHLTNMRSKSSDGTVQLTPATELSLEQCIDFIEDDELLEVTPESLRLRKRALDRNKRKKKS